MDFGGNKNILFSIGVNEFLNLFEDSISLEMANNDSMIVTSINQQKQIINVPVDEKH